MKHNLVITFSIFGFISIFMNNSSYAAQPSQYYMRFEGGVVMAPKAKYDYQKTTPYYINLQNKEEITNPLSASTSLEKDMFPRKSIGAKIGGEIGYYWTQNFRTGLKLGYFTTTNKKNFNISNSDLGPFDFTELFYIKQRGYIAAGSLYYDLSNKTSITPFVGIEVGIAATQNTLSSITNSFSIEEIKVLYQMGLPSKENEIFLRSIMFTDGNNEVVQYIKSKTKIGGYAALKGGIEYKISEDMTLDFTLNAQYIQRKPLPQFTFSNTGMDVNDDPSKKYPYIKTFKVDKFKIKPPFQFGITAGFKVMI